MCAFVHLDYGCECAPKRCVIVEQHVEKRGVHHEHGKLFGSETTDKLDLAITQGFRHTAGKSRRSTNAFLNKMLINSEINL